MTAIDPKIISLIIQEEKKRKSDQYGERAVIQIELPQDDPYCIEKDDEEEQTRGVIVIDI